MFFFFPSLWIFLRWNSHFLVIELNHFVLLIFSCCAFSFFFFNFFFSFFFVLFEFQYVFCLFCLFCHFFCRLLFFFCLFFMFFSSLECPLKKKKNNKAKQALKIGEKMKIFSSTKKKSGKNLGGIIRKLSFKKKGKMSNSFG